MTPRITFTSWKEVTILAGRGKFTGNVERFTYQGQRNSSTTLACGECNHTCDNISVLGGQGKQTSPT
jgi:hypothetical protein